MFKTNEYVNINRYYIYRLQGECAYKEGLKYLSWRRRQTTMVPLSSYEDLLLESADDRVGGISWNDLGVVKHVELLGSIAACV